jgi:hypothetical protein
METKDEDSETGIWVCYCLWLVPLPGYVGERTPLVARNGFCDLTSLLDYGSVWQGYCQPENVGIDQVSAAVAQLGYDLAELMVVKKTGRAHFRRGHYYEFDPVFRYLSRVNGGWLKKNTFFHSAPGYQPVAAKAAAYLLSIAPVYYDH